MNISIRQINVDDWLIFSEIRLKALQTDPLVFGSSYEKESQFIEADWRERLEARDSAVFMLFADETPFGITGVSVFRDDPTKRTAILWGSWLAPEFRGKGLSDLMYKARIDWAKAHPGIERIIVSHRASNLASKYANQKQGFVFTRVHEKVWADGAVEDEVCYELHIKSE
ncbi:MAG TPA: GNAT family protein [Pyrinomonadaceae bacterium]|jgi:RimJ/RimL family protein N-acetyltransferase